TPGTTPSKPIARAGNTKLANAGSSDRFVSGKFEAAVHCVLGLPAIDELRPTQATVRMGQTGEFAGCSVDRK
ncbi:MAG: hypothetical protein WA418_33695, partial [Bradyrhizobium sp.]